MITQSSITAGVKNSAMADFVYQPPPAAVTAKRILIKPNLGYPVPPPVTVSLPVLSLVVQKSPKPLMNKGLSAKYLIRASTFE